MKDIARDLGVSVVTVSKVLRNHSDISVQTRKRVRQRMKELHYQPNPAARALITGRTNLIGLIVPDLVHPFFAQVAKGISAKLGSQQYSLIISSSEDDPNMERREIDQMLAAGWMRSSWRLPNRASGLRTIQEQSFHMCYSTGKCQDIAQILLALTTSRPGHWRQPTSSKLDARRSLISGGQM